MNRCPVCRSEKYSLVGKICTNLRIMGDSFENGDVYVVTCQECGCGFLQSENNAEAYLDYYMSDFSRAPQYYDMFEKTDVDDYFEHIYREISKVCKEKVRVLDFGGSWGELAQYLTNRNSNWKVDVLDPNEKCNFAVTGKGLKVINASSVDFRRKIDEKYDVIIMNHIAEHICNLEETMCYLREFLSDDGVIFFEIPDVEDYADNIAPPYMYLTYEHVVHMSVNDVLNLAGLTGYSIHNIQKYYKKVSNYPSICAILKPGKTSRHIVKKSNTNQYLKKYLQTSYNEIQRAVNNLSLISNQFILWGVGASTTILLDAVGESKIAMLVDGNQLKQGIVYKVGKTEYKICSPEEISNENIPILILSYAYKASIRRTIEKMGIKNKVYSLDEEL